MYDYPVLRGKSFIFGIYVYIIEKYNGSVFYIIYIAEWESFLYFIFYVFIYKVCSYWIIFSGHNKKNYAFSTTRDEKGRWIKLKYFLTNQ